MTLTTSLSLPGLLVSGGGVPDLHVHADPPAAPAPHADPPIYVSPYRTPAGEPILTVYPGPPDCLAFTEVGDFFVGDREIVCRPYAEGLDGLMAIDLLGTVLSFWLERSGIVALHASSVSVHGRAMAFVSDSGSGKSALAASFMDAGHRLISDDIVPLEWRAGEFLARPGYPQMRFWPDQAAHFVGRVDDLELVDPGTSKRRVPVGEGGFGRFAATPQPLAAIYFVERRRDAGGDVILEPATGQRALIDLLRHSFTSRIVHAMGWQARRMEMLTALLRQVPAARLSYPTGFEHLPRVRERLIEALTGR